MKAEHVRKTGIRRSPHGRGGCTIVGIGASAGGIEAIKGILEHLPAKTGLALVFVQHLDPTHTTLLTELLAQVSRVPVREARNGMRVEPDHLYVIPPNAVLTIMNGRLKLKRRLPAYGASQAIDVFLRSLAEDAGSRAVGVILSGTASDGVRGLKAIRAVGGVTLAQDPASAKFANMPRAAADAGCVDRSLTPAKIASELVWIARHPYVSRRAASDAMTAEEHAGLQTIFHLLQEATGVDFSYYKPPTVRRRIARQMALHQVDSLAEYAACLSKNPGEVVTLYEDILIRVTHFFRDPAAFRALRKHVFPKLVAKRAVNDPIRIWVPGCSTGEEAYSLAIALVEFLESRRLRIPIQIFGSDISESSLVTARAGVYAPGISAEVSDTRLRRFFTSVNGHYQIHKSIRELCVFARQNLIQDPPFSRLDLVSCRNVLIYLGPVLQAKVLPVFHYALKPNGYLLLGTAETVSAFPDLFRLVNRQQKIFAKKNTSVRHGFDLMLRDPGMPSVPYSEPAAIEGRASGNDPQREADRLLLARFTPPSVLVTEDLEIVQFRGHTGRYLEPAPGRPNLNLLKMVREGLLTDIRRLLQQAKRRNAAVRHEGAALTVNGRAGLVSIEVIPIQTPELAGRHFLVMFEEGSAPPSPALPPPPQPRAIVRRRIRELESEVRATKEYLQSVIEDFEGANEELKAANEEIRSSNEELQSTNEELETAKEELQSTNEELTTVNEELQNRNDELCQLNNDMTNLLASTQIPIVMLGPDQRIRRFTPAAEKVLKLGPADLGRPITSQRLPVDVPDLERLIAESTDTLHVRQREVQDRQGRWYALRVRPYRTSDNKIDGTVLALMDIDEVERSLKAASAARDFAEAIVETIHEPLLVLTRDLRIKAANRSFCEKFGISRKEAAGSRLAEIGNRQWNIPVLRRLLTDMLRTNAEFHDFPLQHKFPEIGQRSLLLSARPLIHADQAEAMILLAIEDVTDRQQAAITEFSSDAIMATDPAGKFISWNRGAQQLFGYSAEEALGSLETMLIPPDRAAELSRLTRQLRQGRKTVGYQTVRVCKDGRLLDVALTISPVRMTNGRMIGTSCVARDITERKRLEADIQRISEFEKQQLGQDLHDGLAQQLIGLRYLAQSLEKSLTAQERPEAATAAQIIRELEHAAGQTKRLAHGLCPLDLKIGGVVVALQNLAESTSGLFKIRCRVVAPAAVRMADLSVVHQLYRIAQEAVHNAARHSSGEEILVCLEKLPGRVRLTVADDGRGISQDALAHPGMGLRIMFYRAGIIGADLKIRRAPRGGTQVTCTCASPAASRGARK